MADSPAADHTWQVPEALAGERIDRAIALISGLSRREVNEVLADGRVLISGRPVASRSRKVRPGERITITGSLRAPQSAPLTADDGVEVPVVYADEQVVVVDKPAGLVVHPGAGQREGTLVHGLLARFPDIAGLADPDSPERPGIVHRLDKGTSGLLVVARTLEARDSLIGQLADRTMSREYLALVVGTMESDRGLIDAPLGRSDIDPTRVRVQTGGRAARTRYEVEARFAAPAALTLLGCRLETGRTHQIRVHLATIGHPVVGDDRYGSRASRAAGTLAGLAPGRPFLHAAALEFDHPADGRRRRFTSDLPPDLAGVLVRLGADPEVVARKAP